MKDKAAEMYKAFHENVDDIIARQDTKRRKKDQRRIREIRRLMAKSPLGKKLLDWADANNIRIEMDHQTEAGGYYMSSGYKMIGLGARCPNEYLTGTLAHEIRHAWQNSQDLIPTISGMDKPVQDYVTQIKFIEADAFAVGEAVRKTVGFIRDGERREDWMLCNFDRIHPEKTKTPDFESPEMIAKSFSSFFYGGARMHFYESRTLARYAKNIGVKGVVIPCGQSEYINENTPFLHKKAGVSLTNRQELCRLGDVFGKNYMGHLPQNILANPVYRGLHYGFAKGCQVSAKDFVKNDYLLFRYVKHLHKQRRMG